MGTQRDDFTLDTIRRAAGRVGYHCSFPGCRNATIGASMEDERKTSVTGVAAHICAAAEGGPRYDPEMSVDERRGIENCIWLCQTHSKLIDTDVTTYTVAKLREWKKAAETEASRALANGDYFSVYYKNNEDNIKSIEQLFSDMIYTGQYDLLNKLLGQYTTTLSEKYEELVLRYKVIYDTYCNRIQLGKHLTEYCNLACTDGANELIGLFLSFHMNTELSSVLQLCSSETLKEYAELQISGNLISKLLAPIGSDKSINLPEEIETIIQKYLLNYICKNKIFEALDVSGNKYDVYADEFYYHAVSAVYEIISTKLYGTGSFEQLIHEDNYLFIKDNLEKINQLDPMLQEYIWQQLLAFLSEDRKLFETLYSICPPTIKYNPSIQREKYIFQILTDSASINQNELLNFTKATGEDAVLCMYLDRIEREQAIDFLDEHRFLFKESSLYLKLKMDLWTNVQNRDALKFLEKYKTEYAEDITFHLLLAIYTDNPQQQYYEQNWIKTHLAEITPHNIVDYLQFLHKKHEWAELANLSKSHLPNECTYYIAGFLSDSGEVEYLKVANDLYQKLYDIGWVRKGFHLNKGILQRYLGYVEDARRSFQLEYDLYRDMSALMNLIQLRYEMNEFITDKYFDSLKTYLDSHAQNIVGAIYFKRGNYADARRHFLKSLLLDDHENPSLNGYWRILSYFPEVIVNTIKENTFCVLKNDTETKRIAIHSHDIMDGVANPCSFANCTHYSVQDVRVSALLFCQKGDFVEFENMTYEIDEILSVDDVVAKYFFTTLSQKEGTMMIQSSNPEDFISQITTVLKESSDNLDKVIRDYNQSEIRMPLSILSYNTGRSRLKTCEFLAFENKEKIRNNLSAIHSHANYTVFVLAYDAIVYLAHLGFNHHAFSDMDLACVAQVKNQLTNDIDEELAELSDQKQKASMFYKEGNVAFMEYTPMIKRNRYAFLTRLKTFLNSLRVIDNPPVFSASNKEFKVNLENLFLERELFCESSSLTVAKSETNAVLITDDQFLYLVANLEDIFSMGLTGFITDSGISWQEKLAVSKKLKDMNWSNYLPLHLYKQIVDQMLEKETDHQFGSAEIQKWICSDSDDGPTLSHEDIAMVLFRDVYEQNLEYLNPNGFLSKLAIRIFEKRNPGFVRKYVNDTFNLFATKLD